MAKNFKINNPAEAFITQPQATQDSTRELRTERLQIVLTKELKKQSKSRAHRLEISFNEYVNRLIKTDLENEQKER